jgi:GT2 family glycosyltransferase
MRRDWLTTPSCSGFGGGNAPERRISIVVLTHRRPLELARSLRHLCALPEQVPVLVVDNGSNDDTCAMLSREFPQVTVIKADRNLGAAGRNLGATRVMTPYVAFSDDDTWWAPGSLTLAVDLLDRYPQVAALTARVLVGPEHTEDPTCTQMAASPLSHSDPLPGKPILGLLAGASVFRRDAFLAAGGYQPKFFLGGEETLLALDLASKGWTLVYVPALTVFHYPSAMRNLERRRKLLTRNAVWSAWLRLPASLAITRTVKLAPDVWRDAGGIRGWWETLRGLPWALRHRRVIPPEVEAMWRLLERSETTEKGPNAALVKR